MAVTINEADLIKDIDLYLHTYCKAIAKFAENALDYVAAESIANYYGAYSPKEYQRTYDFRDNGYQRFYMGNWYYNKIAHSYVGGIQFNSKNMQPYGNTPAGVVLKANITGWHGRAGHFSPEPLEYVLEYRNKMLAGTLIYKQAHDAAKSKTYKILKV